MTKNEKIPETKDVKPNRAQRRHPEERPEDEPVTREEGVPAQYEVEDPRAKSSGHKKKTADKWNQ
jgi:hypothetical protein